jgi:hypothetical protein
VSFKGYSVQRRTNAEVPGPLTETGIVKSYRKLSKDISWCIMTVCQWLSTLWQLMLQCQWLYFSAGMNECPQDSDFPSKHYIVRVTWCYKSGIPQKQTRVKSSFVNCFPRLCTATTAVGYHVISCRYIKLTHRSVRTVSKTSALKVLVKTILVIKRVARRIPMEYTQFANRFISYFAYRTSQSTGYIPALYSGGSKPSPETGYPDREFSWFFQSLYSCLKLA